MFDGRRGFVEFGIRVGDIGVDLERGLEDCRDQRNGCLEERFPRNLKRSR